MPLNCEDQDKETGQKKVLPVMEKEKTTEKEKSFNLMKRLLESLREVIWEQVEGQIILC